MTPRKPDRPSAARRALRVVLAVGIGAVLLVGGILGYLKWHEEELIFVTALSHGASPAPLPANARRVELAGPGGTRLAAVEVRAAPLQDRGYWVLHLHGNAVTTFSATQVKHLEQLAAEGWSVLSPDYRGFGPTAGRATEAHMYEDAETAYQALRERGIPDDHILLWGHSLGSGPAVYLATRHPAAALVLFGAFTSIPDMAAGTYPWLPVRYIVGVQFDSVDRLPDVHLPVLIAHSPADTIVPFAHALRNYAAAREPKRLLRLDYPTTDGMGGHMSALYDHLDVLRPALAALVAHP